MPTLCRSIDDFKIIMFYEKWGVEAHLLYDSMSLLYEWDIIYQIAIRTLSGLCYLCQQLAFVLLSGIFLIASKTVASLSSYREYPAKSVGKHGEEFLIAVLVKS
jgi:hypothetical protein